MTTGYFIEASPAVAANGEIYFSAPWRSLMAIHRGWPSTLAVNHRHESDHGDIIASPAIGKDGTIYIAEEDWLEAINSTNRLAPLAKSSWPMFRANPRHTGRVEMEKSR